MARSIDARLLNHCDSVRGFHFLWPASLRSCSHADSRSAETRELALGASTDCDHAVDPVSDKTENRRTRGTARNLDRHRIWNLAVDGNAGVRGNRRQWRFGVLRDNGGLPFSLGAGQSHSGAPPSAPVWFPRPLLYHLPCIGYCFLSSRQCHRRAETVRVPRLLVFLSNHLRRSDRPLPPGYWRLEKKANTR